MSRRAKIIIIILVLLVLGVIATVILAPSKQSSADPYDTVCKNLMAAVAKKDFDVGYALLSSTAKNITSRDQWQKTTAALGGIYANGQVTLASRNEVQPANDTDQTLRVQLAYTVKNTIATSNALCTAVRDGKNYVIDSFSSQLSNQEGTEQ